MDPDTVRREWADREGTFSPEFYAHLGPNETSEFLRDVLGETVGEDASVLELGCSSGRHLAHLHDAGFADLHGIEVNADAFEVMAAEFPPLYADGHFHHDTIESVLPDFDDDAFDAVYSVEALQHVHPDAAWVFDDVVRITADTLVTAENEDGAPGADPHGGGPAGDDTEAADAGAAAHPDADADVNYVEDEIPLYYRDWDEVFGERGLTQVRVEEGTRYRTRVFRQPGAVQ